MSLHQKLSSSIKVSALYIYPIKSCRGHILESGVIDARGFQNDRAFMLVDSAGYFLTQREYKRMALIEASVVDASLRLTAPGMSPLQIEHRLMGPIIDAMQTILCVLSQSKVQ